MIMVRMRHLRAAGMCNREPRKFAAMQGWSWNEFLERGLPAELLESTGDPLALRVAEIARREAAE